VITHHRLALAVALFIISSAHAGQDCDSCKRPSLKPLDLSRTPTHEELIASGQLGGNLAPTGPESISSPEDRMAFGKAMDAWNRHDYGRAKTLLKQHAHKFKGSPWKAEAELHLGCEARFNGRYAEAEDYFTGIITEYSAKRGTADGEVLHRAELRLAMLETMRGDFTAAREQWAEILRTDPDRVRRDYARHWLYRVGLYAQNAEIVRRCGTEALAKLLAQMGEAQAAQDVLAIPANPEYGFRVDELAEIARRSGVTLVGVKAGSTERLQTPFLAHYGFKHFVAVMRRDHDGNVIVFDPLQNHEVTLTAEEFAREWSGVALVPPTKRGLLSGLGNRIARLWRSGAKGDPQLLAASQLKEYTGGCCGIENPNTDEGGNVTRVGGSRCDGSAGLSTWSFAPSSVNILIRDTPLWYEPAIGPGVAFSMSYNAIDADNNLPSFGSKWMFNYHSYCVETPGYGNGMVTVFMPDGRNDVYSPISGTNTYTPPGRVFSQLVRLGTNQFSLTAPDGTVYRYGQPAGATNVQQALLASIEDRYSNTVTLVYDGQPNPKLIAVVDALAKTSRIFYSASGLITNIVDPFGRGMVVTYSNEYVSAVRDMGGVESRYTFYTNGLEADYVKTLRTDCGSVTFTYALSDGASTGTWDRSTLTATYADNSREILHYTGTGLTRFTDRNGHMTEFDLGLGSAFPYQGTIESAKHPDGTLVAYQHNAALQVTNIIDEASQAWAYAYNTQGRLTELRTPTGYRLSYAYTNGGFDLARVTEAGSNVLANLSYTAKREVGTVTNALGQAIRYGYDAYGRLTNAVDALSLETVLVYGTNYWLSTVKRAGITVATLQQDALGRTTNVVGPDNIPVAFSFDDLDRLTSLKVASEPSNTWTYQTNSMLLQKQSDRSGRSSRLEYDSLERVRRAWGPDSSFVTFEYDSADNLTSLLDGRGSRTRFVYDSRDRLLQQKSPGGDTESVSYDARSLPVTHTGGRGIVTTHQHDNSGLLTNVSYAATNTAGMRFAFNNRDLLFSSADGWSTNSYEYDLLGRLTNMVETSIAGTQRLAYAYDPLGRLASVTWRFGNYSITNRYDYDTLGRATNVASDCGSFGYSYTNAGLQVSRLTYPNTEYAASAYDSLGRLAVLAYSTGGNWSYAYDSRDFVTVRTNPAGEVFSYKYDDAGRLTDVDGRSGTNVISGYPLRYRYDKSGNRVRQSEGGKQLDLVVDEDNQLLTSQRTNVVTVRGYVNEPGSRVEARSDSVANWTTGTVRYISQTQAYFEVLGILTTNLLAAPPYSNTVWVRAYDPSNNVSTSVVHTAGATTLARRFKYDADGNLVEFPVSTAITQTNFLFGWDAKNQMVSVNKTKSAISNLTAFTYDGFGRLRQIKEYGTNSVLTNTVRYIWSGWQLLGELDGSNQMVRTYTHGVDVSGAVGGAGGIGGLVGVRSYVAPLTNYYVRQDGKGNVTEVRRHDGTVVGSYGYFEFGGQRYETNTYSQGFRWQTKLRHAPSGLTYFGYRWYDPVTARWLSQDPIGISGGLNLYAFCANNPVNFTDPDGLLILYANAEQRKSAWEGLKTLWRKLSGAEARETLRKENPELAGFYDHVELAASMSQPYGMLGSVALPACSAFAEKSAELGSKLEYVLGRATGNAHSIERSKAMLNQLESIGLRDTPATRQLLRENLQQVLRQAGVPQANGRILRESLLMGPHGGVKVQSVWEGNKLITVILHGGGG
jgi:RHS repeat-associated protein